MFFRLVCIVSFLAIGLPRGGSATPINECSTAFGENSALPNSFLFDRNWYEEKVFSEGWLRVLTISHPGRDNVAILKTLTTEGIRFLEEYLEQEKTSQKERRFGNVTMNQARIRYYSVLKAYAKDHWKRNRSTLAFYLTFTEAMLEFFHPQTVLRSLSESTIRRHFNMSEYVNEERLKRGTIFPVFFQVDELDYLKYFPYIYPVSMRIGGLAEFEKEATRFSRIRVNFLQLSEKAQAEVRRIALFLSEDYQWQSPQDRKLVGKFLSKGGLGSFGWKALIQVFNDVKVDSTLEYRVHVKDTAREPWMTEKEVESEMFYLHALIKSIVLQYQMSLIESDIINNSDIWS